MEYRIEALDGRVLWIRECSRATMQADGSVRVDGIVTDVTDQRESADAASEFEGALRATRGRLESVLSAIDEYLYAWRYPVHGPAGRRLRVDADGDVPRTSSRATTTRSRTSGWRRCTPTIARWSPSDVTRGAARRASPGSVEYRICDGQGRTRWLVDRWRCRREPGGVVAEGIVSDITTRKQAQDGMAAALSERAGRVRRARGGARLGRARLEHRPADGAREPQELPELARRGGRRRPKRSRSACSCSTSTTSSARTTPTGTRRATTC